MDEFLRDMAVLSKWTWNVLSKLVNLAIQFMSGLYKFGVMIKKGLEHRKLRRQLRFEKVINEAVKIIQLQDEGRELEARKRMEIMLNRYGEKQVKKIIKKIVTEWEE